MGRTKGSKNKKSKYLEEMQPVLKKAKKSARKVIELIEKPRTQSPVDDTIEKKVLTKEQEERRAKLKTVINDINKDIDGADVNFANTIDVKERQSFGYKCLDTLTGGGIIRGNTTVIWGSKGCGKTTIALKLIATAQKEGKITAYLDVERSYDPIWAKSFGVDTEALVYVVCPTAEAVMDIVIKLCKEKVVDVIVLDSIQGLSPHGEQYEGKADKERSVQDDTMALLARKLSQFFRMATPSISDAKCALLLIGQSRMDLSSFIKMETLSGGHALMHNGRLIIRIRRGQGVDAPTEKRPTGKITEKGKEEMAAIKIGFDLVAHIDKSQIEGCTELNEIHVPFYFDKGIVE